MSFNQDLSLAPPIQAIQFTTVYETGNVTTDLIENVCSVASITMCEYHLQQK